MRKLLTAIALLALPLTSFAADKADDLKLISATQLEKMMTENKSSTFVFDANNKETRTKDGIIPGATLLTSSSEYDAAVLPKDKNATLVFYCANTKCMASHSAAKVAIAKGYKNSIVMSDGIQGWKKAGKPTETLKN